MGVGRAEIDVTQYEMRTMLLKLFSYALRKPISAAQTQNKNTS